MDYPKNVSDFMDVASEAVGKYAEESFHIKMWNECSGGSPIEQLFYMAFNTILRIEGNEQYYEGYANKWIDLNPQVEIGKYRVDFMIMLMSGPPPEIISSVVVELDGHKFHDKNESQRRYEKKRDRHLVSEGHKVLHFTGKEVTDNPFKVAVEVYLLLTGKSGDDMWLADFLPDKYQF